MERRRGHEEATEGLQRFPYLAQSSYRVRVSSCQCCSQHRPLEGHWSSVPLMKWLLTSCVHNSLQAKWDNTGREGRDESAAKRAIFSYCHCNEKSEGQIQSGQGESILFTEPNTGRSSLQCWFNKLYHDNRETSTIVSLYSQPWFSSSF